MAQKEKTFSTERKCYHCGNICPMEVVSRYGQVKTHCDERHNIEWDAGTIYEILLCPACAGILLERFHYHSGINSEGTEPAVLWPVREAEILGLPDRVRNAHEAAKKVKAVDTNAFGVLLRRLLEIVCNDQKASGRTLDEKLQDLVKRGDLPVKLANLAGSLRKMGNIAAHDSDVELSEEEVPYLDALSRAVLEFVYHAPALLREVDDRLSRLK